MRVLAVRADEELAMAREAASAIGQAKADLAAVASVVSFSQSITLPSACGFSSPAARLSL